LCLFSFWKCMLVFLEIQNCLPYMWFWNYVIKCLAYCAVLIGLDLSSAFNAVEHIIVLECLQLELRIAVMPLAWLISMMLYFIVLFQRRHRWRTLHPGCMYCWRQALVHAGQFLLNPDKTEAFIADVALRTSCKRLLEHTTVFHVIKLPQNCNTSLPQ